MKIVFTLASLGSGGAERVVSLLANKMAEQGYQMEIICLKFNDVYYKLHPEVKVTLAMQQTKNRLTEVFWLRKYIKQEKPDVVIAFTEGVYCFTIAALLGTKIPVIASERLDPSAMTWKRNLLKRLLLPYADWLVVQTKTIKDYFPQTIQKKTSVIYNPVKDEALASSIENGKMKMDNSEKPRIISVARLFPQKNQEMMIRVFAKIAEKYPDWKLVIYGEGPRRQSLQLTIDNLQLTERVLLPGRTEKVIDELQKSKIFCLSSDYEGMSNSMIEAICVGLPIISTKVSGTDELIRDGVNGLLVDIGDEQGMTDALEKLIQDEELMKQMGEANRKKASLFQIDTIVNEWMKLINQVIPNSSVNIR
ncbi:MAG: glycosyltransferase family 4 protein [Prevotella sp.]|nr:glycosyltransferase family 4 protein [Prevotella sp.]